MTRDELIRDAKRLQEGTMTNATKPEKGQVWRWDADGRRTVYELTERCGNGWWCASGQVKGFIYDDQFANCTLVSPAPAPAAEAKGEVRVGDVLEWTHEDGCLWDRGGRYRVLAVDCTGEFPLVTVESKDGPQGKIHPGCDWRRLPRTDAEKPAFGVDLGYDPPVVVAVPPACDPRCKPALPCRREGCVSATRWDEREVVANRNTGGSLLNRPSEAARRVNRMVALKLAFGVTRTTEIPADPSLSGRAALARQSWVAGSLLDRPSVRGRR